MDTPRSTLRTALRRVVAAALAIAVLLIMLAAGQAAVSAIGVLSDPHGYGIFAGILLAAILTPIALALWLLHRSLR